MRLRGTGGDGDEGSVLALVPAAFLVLVLLAALAVDSAVAYQARQQLHDALSVAATDAAAGGLDQAAFYSGGSVSLDPGAAGSTVCAALRAQNIGQFQHLQVGLSISGRALRVTATASVVTVFGRAIPGFGTRGVATAADATIAAGPQAGGPPGFPPPVLLRC